MIGVCLNRVLLPVLRDFAGQEISKHYTTLKSSNRIDTQVFGYHVIHDGTFLLNYGSINNNWGTFKSKERLYDYKVITDVDLAKLYLEPFMAKFTGNEIVMLFSLYRYYDKTSKIFLPQAILAACEQLFCWLIVLMFTTNKLSYLVLVSEERLFLAT